MIPFVVCVSADDADAYVEWLPEQRERTIGCRARPSGNLPRVLERMVHHRCMTRQAPAGHVVTGGCGLTGTCDWALSGECVWCAGDAW